MKKFIPYLINVEKAEHLPIKVQKPNQIEEAEESFLNLFNEIAEKKNYDVGEWEIMKKEKRVQVKITTDIGDYFLLQKFEEDIKFKNKGHDFLIIFLKLYKVLKVSAPQLNPKDTFSVYFFLIAECFTYIEPNKKYYSLFVSIGSKLLEARLDLCLTDTELDFFEEFERGTDVFRERDQAEVILAYRKFFNATEFGKLQKETEIRKLNGLGDQLNEEEKYLLQTLGPDEPGLKYFYHFRIFSLQRSLLLWQKLSFLGVLLILIVLLFRGF